MIHSCKIRKPKKNTKKTRTPRKPRRPTGPECLRHRVVFLFLFFVCFSGFCLQFCMPPKKMQRVESCHVLAVLHAPRQKCRELILVICLFSCQSMHISKQRMCKEECKKRTLVIPCSEKVWVFQSISPALATRSILDHHLACIFRSPSCRKTAAASAA